MILFVLALLLFPSAVPCGCYGGRKAAQDAMITPFMRAFLWLDRTVMSMSVPCRGLISAPPSYGPAVGEGCIQDGSWPRVSFPFWPWPVSWPGMLWRGTQPSLFTTLSKFIFPFADT